MVEAEILISKINTQILNPIIGLMIGFALLVFIYGVIEFIAGASSEEKRNTGKKHLVWGLIGLFIMLGVKGFILIAQSFWL